MPGSCDRFKSMAYCNGNFYAVTGTWDLLVCDTSTSPPETTVIWKLRGPTPPRFYLLEFPPADNLLLVTRGSKLGNAGDSEFFSLFMLNWGGPLPEWSRIDSIGDWVLFLSNNHSFALLACERTGCRPNCIYYGDPFYNFQELNVNEADHNIGVYSIEKESVQLIPCLLRNTGDWELASWVRHVH